MTFQQDCIKIGASNFVSGLFYLPDDSDFSLFSLITLNMLASSLVSHIVDSDFPFAAAVRFAEF
jgi:hypothetical protein